MNTIYVIDSCALIDAAQNYNMAKKSFSHIWDAIDRLIQNGELISSAEVIDELKDDDLLLWAKMRKECFVPLTKEVQDKTIELLKRFPTMIKIRSTGNSNADPFLVLTGGTVVTNEKLGDRKGNDCKIPNVCRELKIPYMNLRSFLDQILE